MKNSTVELVYSCKNYRITFQGTEYFVAEEWDETGGSDTTFNYHDGKPIGDEKLLGNLSKIWENRK